jgi:hypothetical protein
MNVGSCVRAGSCQCAAGLLFRRQPFALPLCRRLLFCASLRVRGQMGAARLAVRQKLRLGCMGARTQRLGQDSGLRRARRWRTIAVLNRTGGVAPFPLRASLRRRVDDAQGCQEQGGQSGGGSGRVFHAAQFSLVSGGLPPGIACLAPGIFPCHARASTLRIIRFCGATRQCHSAELPVNAAMTGPFGLVCKERCHVSIET